jgi:hypothetical protein
MSRVSSHTLDHHAVMRPRRALPPQFFELISKTLIVS